MKRRAARFLLAGLLACGTAAQAAADGAAPAKRPTVYALVSAVGGHFSLVRERRQVGTHLEPYQRFSARVAGTGLDGAVLRGLDRVVAESDPGSERVFVRLNPLEMEGVAPHERERVAIGKLVSALSPLPERSAWDRIIAVTPGFLRPERDGLGAKLHGIGVYVQPIEGPRPGDGFLLDLETSARLDPETVSPAGEPSRSRVFVAPYFHTKVWVLDARTLQVLEAEERFDHQKLWDPAWTAIDVEKNLGPEDLALRVETFVENTSARALRETLGVVRVSDPKPVAGASPAEPRP